MTLMKYILRREINRRRHLTPNPMAAISSAAVTRSHCCVTYTYVRLKNGFQVASSRTERHRLASRVVIAKQGRTWEKMSKKYKLSQVGFYFYFQDEFILLVNDRSNDFRGESTSRLRPPPPRELHCYNYCVL